MQTIYKTQWSCKELKPITEAETKMLSVLMLYSRGILETEAVTTRELATSYKCTEKHACKILKRLQKKGYIMYSELEKGKRIYFFRDLSFIVNIANAYLVNLEIEELKA